MTSFEDDIQRALGLDLCRPVGELTMNNFITDETTNLCHEVEECKVVFKLKTYSPIVFSYFRDAFGCMSEEVLISMCGVLLKLMNPGDSENNDVCTDEIIVKIVQCKEGEFLKKMLPGYYLHIDMHFFTLLPKFFGLYRYQSNSKNVWLVAMNNILPSSVKLHQKYELKGSTYNRKASEQERAKESPTYKDLDFMEHHPDGIFLEANTYARLKEIIRRDCRFLESFGIMDYSLLLGIHNLDEASREKTEARNHTDSPTGDGDGQHTDSPTSVGDGQHTDSPTGDGDGQHTDSPTGDGDGQHTDSPTGDGDGQHTDSPTSDGDDQHTDSPTGNGDGQHTDSPTGDGEGQHTDSPTSDGDDQHTDSPTGDGDGQHTDSPTGNGDGQHTDSPTGDGDGQHTDSPTGDGDGQHTDSPTGDGDGQHTDSPTGDGDGQHTDSPTGDGDGQHTDSPTGDGDDQHTDSPTGDGDDQHTDSPTGDGDGQHTDSPTGNGDGQHTDSPTSDGDGQHTDSPTGNGDGQHTDSPTGNGDGQHTDSPTGNGDGQHTDSPTSDGDGQHTDSPTGNGDGQHTDSPTGNGDGQHTDSPTGNGDGQVDGTELERTLAESGSTDGEDDLPIGGIPAWNARGDRLLLYLGIINTLQTYGAREKLQHTWNRIIRNGDTVSVHTPSFYAKRFHDFMGNTVFKKTQEESTLYLCRDEAEECPGNKQA